MQKNDMTEAVIKEEMIDAFTKDKYSCREERILRRSIEGKTVDDILKELCLPTRYDLF